jgi:hypothetical protein
LKTAGQRGGPSVQIAVRDNRPFFPVQVAEYDGRAIIPMGCPLLEQVREVFPREAINERASVLCTCEYL